MSAIGRSSFAGPAAMLPGPVARPARALYGACRAVDDLADATGGIHAQRALGQLNADLEQGKARSETAATFLALHRTHGLDLAQARHLVRAVASDLDHRPVASWAELLDYAQGVAGTVGLMMCDILGVRDAGARRDGAALGRAMQLTNIARDVQADARMGRRYLPGTLCPWPPDRLACDDAGEDPEVRDAVRQVLGRAETLYDQGFRGLPALSPSARVGVAAAALTYRDIGRRIAALGYRPREAPKRPTGLRRVTLAGQALRLALHTPRRETVHAS